MPYEDAKTYRYNPFDLTKIWPHSDYPLIKVGTMTLNRNPENFFAQIEQAAFEPSAAGAGHRLLARQDAARPGVRLLRHAPLPDRRRTTSSCRSTGPRSRSNTYTQDGAMAYEHRGDDPVYAPNSFGRGYADQVGEVEESWETDGAMVRQAYTLRADDDDFGQAGTLVRDVWTDEIREAFVKTVAGHLLAGVEGDVLERAFQYWKHVDADTGKRIEELVRSKSEGDAPAASPRAPRRTRVTRSWRVTRTRGADQPG